MNRDLKDRVRSVSNKGLNVRQYTLLIALIVLILVFDLLTRGKVLTPINMNNLIMQNSYVVILAVGMLPCILLGGINLAVGSAVALSGGVGAILMMQYNVPISLAILIILLVGVLIGIIEGFFVAYVKVPPFIVTLADMLILRGAVLVLLKSQTIGPLPATFIKIGAGHLPSVFTVIFGQQTDLISLLAAFLLSALIIFNEIRRYKTCKTMNSEGWQIALKLILILLIMNFYLYKLSLNNGLPVVLLIICIVVLLYHFLTQRTVIGRQIYAVGGNENAAKLSGLQVDKVKFWVYVNCGILSGLAGMILASRNGSATPSAGINFELDAVASCFIGGASTSGGVGTVIGAITGAFIMGVLNNGMSLMGVSVDWQRIVKGLVLLGAVTLDLYNRRRTVK